VLEFKAVFNTEDVRWKLWSTFSPAKPR